MYYNKIELGGHRFILKSDRYPTPDEIWSWYESIHEFFNREIKLGNA